MAELQPGQLWEGDDGVRYRVLRVGTNYELDPEGTKPGPFGEVMEQPCVEFIRESPPEPVIRVPSVLTDGRRLVEPSQDASDG